MQAPENTFIEGGTIASDGSAVVYCLREGNFTTGVRNLRVLDLSKEPVTDTVITNDGVSCDPMF